MFHYKSIAPPTLELLREVSKNKGLNKFYLVGGTALALHLGHRISVDLDFFCSEDFESMEVIELLKQNRKIQIMTSNLSLFQIKIGKM
ncbi:MAG: nucleotidyl transferase AbiEii/AbiGii toxin family protein [Bacteroidetes bacterium]|nr:nucleotidyl transferase AbiEii/AbiGii toxin family protein [Bacteroidota bacterium]MBU1718531.1 nucleotidyl transferase AbiEii/AbiGii toxin family protein [Bacteroidota bacterium]